MALAMLTMIAGTGALDAQDRRERERELRRELRELEERIEEIWRELGETRFGRIPPFVVYSSNRARLGVLVRTEANEETDSVGAYLTGVTPGGPADEEGLRAGDIIVSLNGEPLAGEYDEAGIFESEPGKKLVDLARELEDGDSVEVEYRRGNRTHTATIVARKLSPGVAYVTPEAPLLRRRFEVPMPEVIAPRLEVSFGFGSWLDMELVRLNPDLGEYFGTDEGLLVVKAPDDESIDLKSGDVILRIGDRAPRSPSHAMRILRSYTEGETVTLQIMRNQRRTTVTVEVPEQDEGRDLFRNLRRRRDNR